MVVVPRLALYYKEKKINEYNLLISKTFRIIIILSLPMIIGLFFVVDDVVRMLYGTAYANSATVVKIQCFLLLVSPIGYLLGSRVMLITNQERKMFISVSIGAIVSLIGNFILIKQFAEYGAAIALIISEIVIMIVYITFSHKYFKLIKVIPSILKVFTASIGMIVLLYIESQLSLSIYIKLLIQIISSAFVYFGILLLVKENTVSEYAIKFIKK
jgi:O-antigen/teichoic acid export membrane protein